MAKARSLTAVTLGGAIMVAACGSEPASAPEPVIEAGQVTVAQGLADGVPSDRDPNVWVYRGLPFAAPPVGDLRWRPPEPSSEWTGVRDASAAGASCIQVNAQASNAAFYDAGVEETSEDCLYLNVWTAASSGDELPVLVWIHGGGLRIGNGADSSYDGAALAGRGAVVVTINYRMGALGYLAHPLLSEESAHGASGNYGVLDQIAALRWIQDNIAAFGGDPNRVTIFGGSAGAWSVNYVTASPLAAGLVHGAIGQSGGNFGPAGSIPKATAEAAGGRFVEALLGEGTEVTLAAMRAASAEEVLGVPMPLSRATVDGWVFPASIYEIFAAGNQMDIPVIVGSNADEGTMFTPPEVEPEAYRAGLGGQFGDLGDEFLATYPAGDTDEAWASQVGIFTDTTFGWEMRTWARMMATVPSDAYLYFFSRKPPTAEGDPFAHYGAYHTAEIPYVFDNFGVSESPHADRAWDDTDRELSNVLASYWVNFAATGDPNGEELPEWPAFDANADEVLEIGDTIQVRAGVRKVRLDLVDKHYAVLRTAAP